VLCGPCRDGVKGPAQMFYNSVVSERQGQMELSVYQNSDHNVSSNIEFCLVEEPSNFKSPVFCFPPCFQGPEKHSKQLPELSNQHRQMLVRHQVIPQEVSMKRKLHIRDPNYI
jgi:hypothetical protein